MSKALDAGKSFIATVLAKLPESLRADAEKALTAPEAADALTLVGDGVLARSDYSKQMDAIREKETTLGEDYTKLNEWYDTNKERLAKVDTLEAQIAKLSGQEPPPQREPKQAAVGMTREELEAHLTQRDQGYASVLALTTTLATKHLRDFNEVLDVQELVTDATKRRVSLDDAYRTKYGEQIQAKAKAAEDDRINKLVTERMAEERKKSSDQPFPLRNASPSVLDVLDHKDGPAAHTIDSALAEYERLQATR